MKSPLKYPGGKTAIAPWIVSHFPPHRHYLEPFVGSGAVFFSKPPSARETLNDLDSRIVGLFRVLRHPAQCERLVELVEMTPHSEEELHAAAAYTGDDPVMRAWATIVVSHFAVGAEMRHQTAYRHVAAGTSNEYPPRTWQRLPGMILATASRLKNAQISRRDAVHLIKTHAAEDTLVYADPPYLCARRKMYAHEMTSELEHERVLTALKAHPGSVVLSGYAHPLYADMLAGWTQTSHPGRSRSNGARTEVLWSNPKAWRESTAGGSISLLEGLGWTG